MRNKKSIWQRRRRRNRHRRYENNRVSVRERYHRNKPRKEYNPYSKRYDIGNYDINVDWDDYHCDVPYYAIGDQDQICDYCGANFWFDERLNYKKCFKPRFGSKCCNKGKIQIPLPRELPPYLDSLFCSDSEEAIFFQKNIRAFNSLFTFASIKSKFKPKEYEGQGYYVYRVEGVLHHYIGPLESEKGQPSYGLHIYMHDSDEQIEYRCNMYALKKRIISHYQLQGLE